MFKLEYINAWHKISLIRYKLSTYSYYDNFKQFVFDKKYFRPDDVE